MTVSGPDLEIAAGLNGRRRRLATVVGASIRRIADAAGEMFLRDVEAPLKASGPNSDLEMAQANLAGIDGVTISHTVATKTTTVQIQGAGTPANCQISYVESAAADTPPTVSFNGTAANALSLAAMSRPDSVCVTVRWKGWRVRATRAATSRMSGSFVSISGTRIEHSSMSIISCEKARL